MIPYLELPSSSFPICSLETKGSYPLPHNICFIRWIIHILNLITTYRFKVYTTANIAMLWVTTLWNRCVVAQLREARKDFDWRILIDPRIYQKDAGNMMRNMSKQIQERNPIIKLFMQDKRGIKEQRCDVRIYTYK